MLGEALTLEVQGVVADLEMLVLDCSPCHPAGAEFVAQLGRGQH